MTNGQQTNQGWSYGQFVDHLIECFGQSHEAKRLKKISGILTKKKARLERIRTIRRKWADHRGYHPGITDDEIFQNSGSFIMASMLRREFSIERQISKQQLVIHLLQLDCRQRVLDFVTSAVEEGKFVPSGQVEKIQVWRTAGSAWAVKFDGIHELLDEVLKKFNIAVYKTA